MSTRNGKESTESRGATSWNDGVHPIDGAGLTDGGLTKTQGVSAGPGGTQRGDAGTIPKTSWFEPIDEFKDCPGGVCPVPWAIIPERPVVQEDVVNSPSHYKDQGSIECIEAIESQLTPEEYQGYLRGNCVKYLWRWRNKGGVQDLKKSQWYLNRLIETEEI